jgi:hypothetical protein
MAIAVLAYGSLITNPGSELEAVTLNRIEGVVTPFRVEFARSSKGRSGAPTLVPVSVGGACVKAVLLEVSVDETEAADIVFRREIDEVGSDRPYCEPPPGSRNRVFIDRLSNFAGFEVVLSTRISDNIDPLSAEILADLAIESAAARDDGRDGISYLIAAKDSGIETLLSPEYEASILRKTGASDLAKALAYVRRQTGHAGTG